MLAQATSDAAKTCRALLPGLIGDDVAELHRVDELPELLELAVTHLSWVDQ